MSWNKPGRARAIMAFSGFWPFIAGLFKGFTYTFGALTFLTLATTGSLVVTLPILMSPLLPLSIALGASVVLISWGMEGAALFKRLSEKLQKTFKVKWEDPYRLNGSTPRPDGWFVWGIKLFVSMILYGIGSAIPAMAAVCKAFAATAGTIATLLFILNATGAISTIALTANPISFVVIIAGLVAGITVGSVCLGKEGYTFFERVADCVDYIRGIKQIKAARKQQRYITGVKDRPTLRSTFAVIGYIIPVIAAIAKSFTYTFGAVNLLNFLMTGAFVVTSAMLTSPIFPIACALGCTLFFVSLGMEGKGLAKKLYRAAFSLFNIRSYKLEKNEKLIGLRITNIISKAESQYEYKMATSIEPMPFNAGRFTTFYCYALRVLGVFAAAGTSLAKGMSGAAGTMATLLFIFDVTGALPMIALSFTSPVGIFVLVCGIIAGITIAGLSASKEGPALVRAVWRRTSAWLGHTTPEQQMKESDSAKKLLTEVTAHKIVKGTDGQDRLNSRQQNQEGGRYQHTEHPANAFRLTALATQGEEPSHTPLECIGGKPPEIPFVKLLQT